MNKEKNYIGLNNKLKELKKLIADMDTHAMELIYISAKIEMKLRKKDLERKEIADYELSIDKLIKDIQQNENNNTINFKRILNMKQIILFLSILITSVIISGSAQAQVNNEYKWVSPTPQGNDLYWVKMWNANNWYAVGDGATFMKTTNAGANWIITNNLILFPDQTPNTLKDAYFFNMNTGFTCGYFGKILKTTNGGGSWITYTYPDSTQGFTAMDFLNNNTGFVTGSITLKTTDGGTSWSVIRPSALNAFYDIVAKDTNNIILGYIDGKISKTTNGGTNWNEVNIGLPGYVYKLAKAGGDTLYAVTTSARVGMTTNVGATWTNLTGGLGGRGFLDVDIVTSSGTKYAYLTGNQNYVYRAPAGSSTWDSIAFRDSSQIYDAQNNYFHSSDFSVTGDTFITVGEQGYINARYSQNNRKQITRYFKYAYYVYDIWAVSDIGKVITAGDRTNGLYNQIMYSTNGGSNWQQSNIPNTDNSEVTGLSMLNNSSGYSCTYNGSIYKTTDGGINWSALTSTGSNTQDIYFLDANTGYTFGDGGFKTTNGGINWSTYAPGQTFEYILASYFVNANTGWTVGEGGEIFKTTNGGANVTQQNAGVGSEDIPGIYMINANTGWIITYDGSVRKTTNGGTNWETLSLPYASDLYAISFKDEFNGLIGGRGGLIYRTRDGGTTWEVGNTSAQSSNNAIFMTATNRAFIGGDDGQLFRYEETVTGTELTYTNNTPTEYRLEQNYPNPFNPSTTIKFSIPMQSVVSLKIYDIAGREVAALFNGQRLNAGTFEQRFDGSRLSSGVYFYSLVVNGQLTATKKMVFVK